MVVFLGDFNYRLDGISYDEARDFVSQRCFDWLKERDQLRAEMEAGNVFQGMREAVVRFPPTYKFERHQAGLAGSFCSELYLFLDHVLVTWSWTRCVLSVMTIWLFLLSYCLWLSQAILLFMLIKKGVILCSIEAHIKGRAGITDPYWCFNFSGSPP